MVIPPYQVKAVDEFRLACLALPLGNWEWGGAGNQAGLQEKELFLQKLSTTHTNPMFFLILKPSSGPPLFLVTFYIRLGLGSCK